MKVGILASATLIATTLIATAKGASDLPVLCGYGLFPPCDPMQIFVWASMACIGLVC